MVNIFIPLCGKGERFQKEGYSLPKPLIPVLGKPIFFYVLDSIHISNNEKIFIIYHSSLNYYNFINIILENYPNKNIVFIPLNEYTKGAAETIYKGIEYCFQHNLIQINSEKYMCYDCDTFYTLNTVSIYTNILSKNTTLDGAVFYFHSDDPNPIYSYISLNTNSNIITQIAEKQKISNCANSGIYCFTDIQKLYTYCEKVVYNSEKYMNGECYISCVIKEMLSDGLTFKGIEIPKHTITSLGTPKQVKEYSEKCLGFLFDLDGTLVLTDEIYFNVWETILSRYNIVLDKHIFKKYIQGNNDLYVLKTLLPNVSLSLQDLSTLKDSLFIKSIDKLSIIPGAEYFIQNVKSYGHKVAIVTNCNRLVAEKILNHTKINKYIDILIISNECVRSKPYPDPYIEAMNKLYLTSDRCFIFEDSKTGLLSGKNVSPRILFALQTIYSETDAYTLGANISIPNYLDLNVTDIINKLQPMTESLKNYIIQSLQKSNCFQKEDIQDVKIDSSKLKGGYITDAIRVTIVTNFNSYDCVLKLENKNQTFLSKMAQDLGLYEREYYFYEAISSYCSSIGIPKFYCLIHDTNSNVVGILLENLFVKGCKLNLDLNIESIDTTLQVVNDCAKLHSTFINKDCLKLFPELKKHNDPLFQPVWPDFIHERWELFKEKWSNLLSEYHLQVGEYIVKHFTDIQDYLSNGKLTLCHGDVKSPNLFYLQIHESYKPFFIDWQYIAYGKGVQDIVFFLIESFEIEKSKQLAHLVKEYYYLKCKEYSLSQNEKEYYSIEEYNKDFIYSIFYFPFFVAIWFGTLSQDDLIDKNFPFFFIQKLFHFIDLFKDEINKVIN